MIDTSSAKAEILASIRQNLAASRPFDTVYNEHHHLVENAAVICRTTHAVRAGQGASAYDLLPQFKTNLEAVAGKCRVVSGEKEVANAIQGIIDGLNPQAIAISDSDTVNDLIDRINTDAAVLKNASKSELFDCDVGITTAQWAIAETGTLVLESDQERSRLTSLLPPVHICVLDAKKIRSTMGEILQVMQKDLSKTVTFITGPSRTSDIELTLAIGVHGPRELYVIVVSDETNA